MGMELGAREMRKIKPCDKETNMSRLLDDITNFIFMSDEPKPSDVILIPGSPKAEHILCAAELYRKGFAPYVLPSGKYSYQHGRFLREKISDTRYTGDYETEFEFCKAVLLQNGVPDSAIIKEDRATNTFENAAFSAKVLREKEINVKRALLCCQAFHARRAFMTYSCYFEGCELLVIPSDTENITKGTWYRSQHGFSVVTEEIRKCGAYFENCREALIK